MKVWLGLVIVFAPVAMPACSGRTCQTPEVVSDTTSGTYSYTAPVGEDGGAGGADGGIDAGETKNTGNLDGVSVSATSATTIQLVGMLSAGSFTITLSNVVNGRASLGPQSNVCFSTNDANAGLCETLSGTLSTSSFNTSCSAGGCALVVDGSLRGTASWEGGSFSIDATLNHQEQLASYACGGNGLFSMSE
jgi:hypothetical protein